MGEIKTKLICSVCGHDKFTEGGARVFTCNPPIHVQDYVCDKCGNIESVSNQEKLKPNKPKEVWL